MGQLFIEMHLDSPAAYPKYKAFVHAVEKSGLRLFHKEINLINFMCIELSFIQANWSPDVKNFTSEPPKMKL